MGDTLVVNEIYLSLQGESTWAGWPCIFVRLAGCNLRCSYCDTAYAFTEGRQIPLEEIRREVHRLALPFDNPVVAAEARRKGTQIRNPKSEIPKLKAENRRERGAFHARSPHKLPLVELTGGEPLLQSDSLPLMKRFCDDGFTVLLETSGALDIARVDRRVHRIMDLKCPSSAETERNRWENLKHVRGTDEIKFVIGTREDYAWAKQIIAAHNLAALCPLLVSWVSPLTPEQQDRSLKEVPSGQTPLTRQQLAEMILADALPVRVQLPLHKFIWPEAQRGV